LESTHLAATEFVDWTGDRYVRVYYQNEDCRIKESRYDTKTGWNATAIDVAVTARNDSPIALASWNKGTTVKYKLTLFHLLCNDN
jgi:hypothetical protein